MKLSSYKLPKTGLMLVFGRPGSGKDVCVVNSLLKQAKEDSVPVANFDFSERTTSERPFSDVIANAPAIGGIVIINEPGFGFKSNQPADVLPEITEIIELSKRHFVVLVAQTPECFGRVSATKLLSTADILVALRGNNRDEICDILKGRTYRKFGFLKTTIPPVESFIGLPQNNFAEACILSRRKETPTQVFGVTEWRRCNFSRLPLIPNERLAAVHAA